MCNLHLRLQGMGTQNQFTVIECGASNNIIKGSDAMGKMVGADRLFRVSGLDKVCGCRDRGCALARANPRTPGVMMEGVGSADVCGGTD